MNSPFPDDTEVLFDPHSPFGIHLQETTAAPNADPLEILIQLEEYVKEEFGVVVVRAKRTTIQIRSK